jgi:hypothetical protein
MLSRSESRRLIAALNHHLLWRVVLTLFGAAAYYLAMWVAASELKRFVGINDGSRPVFRLAFIPYATAGFFACCAGALNRTMPAGIAIGLAAASSFGAGFGMLRLPAMQRAMSMSSLVPGVFIKWNAGWAGAALAVIAAFFIVIGPGVE